MCIQLPLVVVVLIMPELQMYAKALIILSDFTAHPKKSQFTIMTIGNLYFEIPFLCQLMEAQDRVITVFPFSVRAASVDPDQTPQHAASDLGQHLLPLIQ